VVKMAGEILQQGTFIGLLSSCRLRRKYTVSYDMRVSLFLANGEGGCGECDQVIAMHYNVHTEA